jgi:hypothetical protein
MRCLWLLLPAALLLGAVSLTGRSTRPAGAVELPLSRLVLFSSGVGYFQRSGTVEGDARVDLQFPAGDINDLLKSLILQDLGGGQVGAVTYESRDAVERTPHGLATGLAVNPSFSQLLFGLRGEQVEIGLPGGQTPEATLTGQVIGIEKQQRPVGGEKFVEVEYLNLLTREGIRSLPLEQLRRVRVLRAELDQEFRRALASLVSSPDDGKKTLHLNFLGNGKRSVRVGYIAESPIWKATYRLALARDRALLQGWAIVDNTSDEDWNDVRVGLIAGRPISFRMDLYEPLYVLRPLIQPELFASLRPPTYSGPVEEWNRRAWAFGGFGPARQQLGALGAAGGFGGGLGGGNLGGFGQFGQQGGMAQLGGQGQQAPGPQQPAEPQPPPKRPADGINLREGVMSAAIASQLGEYYQYHIDKPVSLPRQKAALLPILNQDVKVTRVSVYNEAVQRKHPLHGLRFKNDSGLHLMQGPVTVFADDTYAGDSRLPDLQPNETRLVSYAIDLGVEVLPEAVPERENLEAVKIVRGVLHAAFQARRGKTYTLRNRSDHERTVLIAHPVDTKWRLAGPPKPVERSREFYRFEVKAGAGKNAKLEVGEEMARSPEVALAAATDEALEFYLRVLVTSPKVRAALEEVQRFKAQAADLRGRMLRETSELGNIERDQERLRKNVERVPPTSEAYKRYLRKFDEQETEIERRRAQLAKLQEQSEQQAKAHTAFLANLNVE